MSDHEASPAPKPMFPAWLLTATGIIGSILVMFGVLAVAYVVSKPGNAVDASIAAERAKALAEVQAKQNELYHGYSVAPSPLDPKQKIIRIPVEHAMKIIADDQHLGGSTKDKPEPPARLSLAASPAGFTPPAPPAQPAPAAAPAPTPAAPAPAAATPPR